MNGLDQVLTVNLEGDFPWQLSQERTLMARSMRNHSPGTAAWAVNRRGFYRFVGYEYEEQKKNPTL